MKKALLLLVLLAAQVLTFAQYLQLGSKLVGTGSTGSARFGWQVAMSADSSTVIVGAPAAHAANRSGGAWIYTRQGNNWLQQAFLVPSDNIGAALAGFSVAIAADGNTILMGGYTDNDSLGASWVFVRSGNAWSQQAKLVAAAVTNAPLQGYSVALSGDGNTALIGAPGRWDTVGRSVVFVRSGITWSQQATLVGSHPVGYYSNQGSTVSLSFDGNTAAVASNMDSNGVGAAWLFNRNGAVWVQNGNKITYPFYMSSFREKGLALSGDGLTLAIGDGGYGNTGQIAIYRNHSNVWTYDTVVSSPNYDWHNSQASEGSYIAMNYDGTVMAFSGPDEEAQIGYYKGHVYIFKYNGTSWVERFNSNGLVNSSGHAWLQGVALNGTGTMAAFGGWYENYYNGAAWVYRDSMGTWTNAGGKLFGTGDVGSPAQGSSLAISADGSKIITGGPVDNGATGATWTFAQSGNTYLQQGFKMVANTSGWDAYGRSVAISGNGQTALIPGMSYYFLFPANHGAWVYKDSSGQWAQDGPVLQFNNGGALGGGGAAISRDGNTLAFGDVKDSSNVGAGWLYVKSGNQWVQQAKLRSPVGTYQFNLIALSADGNVLVTATMSDTNVCVFRRVSGVWQREYNFGGGGSAVAISDDGNTVAVGTQSDSTNFGAVRVYQYNGGWGLQAKLRCNDALTKPGFGSAAALSADGNTLAVGGVTHNANQGAAWIFKRSGNNWVQLGSRIVPNDVLGAASVGSAIALSADARTLVIGGKGDNDNLGATWVYKFAGLSVAADTIIKTSCSNSSDGKIIADAANGQQPYTFRWSVNGAANSDTLSNLSTGTYYLTVYDASGDSATALFNMGTSSTNIQITPTGKPQCGTDHNGQITLTVNGGVYPYTYAWSPNQQQTDSILDSLLVGTYFYTVTDANNCAINGSATISYTSFWTSAYPTSTNCHDNNGSGQINVYGGTSPFAYVWSNGETVAHPTNLHAGQHTFTVTDAVGCNAYGNIVVDSICYDVIEGNLFYDVNGNCVKDNNEIAIAGTVVDATSGGYAGYAFTDAAGNFSIRVRPGFSYTLSLPDNYYHSQCGNYTVCGNSGQPITVTGTDDTISGNNIGIAVTSSYDLGIRPGWTVAHAGEEETYFVRIYSAAYAPYIGNDTVRFYYDPALTFVSSVPPITGSNVNPPFLEWIFLNDTILPNTYSIKSPEVVFNVPVNIDSGQSLRSEFVINPVQGDCYPWDNDLSNNWPLGVSHDPNAKTCKPDSLILPTDTVLTYTIHFQNTGTDTARFIVIKDTLSANVDPGSAITIATSHTPYKFDIIEDGILSWTFDPISLPDSNTNVAASQGFIMYTVKVKNGLVDGTIIDNRASIYFDYNDAVVTNTQHNITGTPLVVQNITSSTISVIAFPNPFADFTTFKISGFDKGYDFNLMDAAGKVVSALKDLNTETLQYNRRNLAAGIYMYRITDKQHHQAIGKIVIE